MSKCLSCFTNGIYIGDYPPEEDLPVRPISQQQLSHRQRQSTRARSRRLANPNSHESSNVQSQGRGRRGEGGERAGLEEYGDSDGDEYEEDGIHTPRTLSHRRRSQRDGHELDEVDDEDEDEDGDGYGHNHTSRHRLETTLRSRNHAEELLFQRRQSAHSQLPRRLQPVPSQYENDYDPDVIRQERSTRRGAREGGMRRRQNGSEDAPPRYEDHVFDRVVGGGDDDDA